MSALGSRVVAFVPDLMDRSKVAAAAGDRVHFVADLMDLVAAAADADVVVVDLGRPAASGVLADVVAVGAPVVAFGSHVDRDTLAAARRAGCAQVLARSAFFAALGTLLA